MITSLYTASDSLEQNCIPLSERRLAGHPQRGMYLLTRISALLSAMTSAAETAYMSGRRLNVSPRRNRQEAVVVDAHRDTRASWQGEREWANAAFV